MKKLCLNCKKKFDVPLCRVGKYCSRKCHHIASRGVSNSPNTQFQKEHSYNKNAIRTNVHKEKISQKLKGRKLSIKTRMKMRDERLERVKKGTCNLWKGGVTAKNAIIRSSLDYKLWREKVFKRDNYTCIKCGIRNEKGSQVDLQADHIKPFAYFPVLRFELSNGRTLCKECHRKTDSFARKAQLNYQYNESLCLK